MGNIKGTFRAARTDANQVIVVDALRAAGASVAILSALGHGIPDLLVGYQERNYLLEVKDGSKPASRRRLTQKEHSFFEDWRGHMAVVDSIDEAFDVIGLKRE
jgi:hypothetical protein